MITRTFYFVILLFSFFYTGITSASTGVHALRTYPNRNAVSVNVHTSIGISYDVALDSTALEPGSILVTGSKHGNYSGTLDLSLDHKTLIFAPSEIFGYGETITVSVRSLSGEGRTAPEYFTFTTTAIPTPERSAAPEINKELLSIPDSALLPKITVTKKGKPYPGEIYFANYGDPSGIAFRIKVDTAGTVTYAKRSNNYCTDFKANPNGTTSWVNVWAGHAYIADTSDKIIDSVSGANGHPIDVHEFRFSPEGNFVIIADDNVITDMSQVGGKTNATVIYPVIQEFDKTHHLIFEWNTRDYFNMFDGTHESYQAQTIDFSHMNSIDFDYDTNFIVSNRNMDELTKIDRKTGRIIWRMGGNNNEFTFEHDKYGFSGQHHFRRLDNGNYTAFDDGNYRPGGVPFSRAIEYKIDEEDKTVTELWEFRHIPDRFATGMGSTQRLPNGNTLIGWGWADTVGVTEVDSLGNTQFELNFGTGTHSYRAYKFDSKFITSGLVGQISAADLDFGTLSIGQSDWHPVLIKNNGLGTLTLTSAYVLSDTVNFSVDPAQKFPLDIKPGASAQIKIYFHPQINGSFYDSILWATGSPADAGQKNKTYLTAQSGTSGVSSQSNQNHFSLSPNPASENVITLRSHLTGSYLVNIFNVLGKEMYHDEFIGEQLQIPIKDFSEGVYYVRIQTGNSTWVEHFSRVK